MPVVFECAGKEIPHKSNNFFIKLFRIAFLNRCIIFIDHNDRCFSIMFMKHFGKFLQRRGELYFIRLTCQYFPKIILLVWFQFLTHPQFLMSAELFLYQLCNFCKSQFPGRKFYIFKRQKNNRIFSLMLSVFFSTFPDFFVSEILAGICIGNFKENAKHIHIQRLSKSSRPRKQ